MDISQQLCMSCMRPIEPGTLICPHCSHNALDTNKPYHLHEKTVLAGQYYIGSTISVDKDSVKYIALDLQTKKCVEVIEFFPESLADRDTSSGKISSKIGMDSIYNLCLHDYVKLWKTIESLKGNLALPNVTDVFVYNSTAYAVTEKINTITLKKYLNNESKLLSWNNCISAYEDIINAVERLHANGILHCAISSKTVLVGSDGKLHLSGFSVPQVKIVSSPIYSEPQDGFAPIELYDRRLSASTYTDVYSLAAVIYFSLTGIEPQSSVERVNEDAMMIPFDIASKIEPSNIEALFSALQIYPRRRTQTVGNFMSEITKQSSGKVEYSEAEEEPAALQAEEENVESAEDTKEKKPLKAALFLKVTLSALLILSMLFCTLYSTVLYKNIQIGFLNDALCAFSFLPMNSNSTNSESKESDENKKHESNLVTVADFMSLTYSDILNNETFNKNFKLEYEFEASDSIAKNCIISQSIEKYSKVTPGTVITIVVSTGKPISVLKDVIGMQYDEARELLVKDGFIVEKQLLENDGYQTAGEVFTMSLVAGFDFEKGTKVILSVWDEVQETETQSEQNLTDTNE